VAVALWGPAARAHEAAEPHEHPQDVEQEHEIEDAEAEADDEEGSEEEDEGPGEDDRGWVDVIDEVGFATEGEPVLRIGDADRFWFTPRGQVQVQFVPFVGDESRVAGGDPSDEVGFRIRRARFGFDAGYALDTEVSLTLEAYDGRAGGAELLDASIKRTLADWLFIDVGVNKVPFSAQFMTDSRELTLIERPFGVDVLGPDRSLGVKLGGDIELAGMVIGYRAGVYNGSETVSQGNQNPGLLYAGRLTFEPLGAVGRGLSDFERSERIRARIGASGYVHDGEATDTAGAGADVTLKWYGIALTAEFMWNRTEPDARPALPGSGLRGRWERHAWYVEGAYLLPGARLEVAARYERSDDNIFEKNLKDIEAVTVGVNFYALGNRVKSQLNYRLRNELGGPELDNDAVWLQTQVAF
jgi:hypothetical protein